MDELLSEFALARVEGPKTVAAYARDDLLEKRRPVMPYTVPQHGPEALYQPRDPRLRRAEPPGDLHLREL